jgi:demethylmenaquinone methyltransferase/2-methoxy-6-polyprenyl-1,4-benzoquinol methylase
MSTHETDSVRAPSSKWHTQANYDRLSRWYDLFAGRSEQKLIRLGLEMLHLREGETVLEIGFGTGRALVALASAAGEVGRVYGADLSPGMCRRALARIRQAGVAGRVDLWSGDAMALGCSGRAFDAVLMSFTLELFDAAEMVQVLGECQRVLRPGGRCVVVAMSGRGRAGLISRLYRWAHQTFPTTVDCRPIVAQQALQDAGFCILEVTQAATWGLPVDIVLAVHRGTT